MAEARMVRLIQVAVATICLSGCTLISGASDYKVVDPEARDRDLSYDFVGMIAHAGVALDVAVVDESKLLQARARIILPPPVADFPTEHLEMINALTPGKQTLYFFADNNGDGLVDGSKKRIVEHIWIEPVPAEGVGEFVHNTNFDYFNEDAYTPLNGALVLEMPKVLEEASEAVLKCIDLKLGKQLDVTLTLVEQERQVGLFRRYRGTEPPMEVRLSGVLDGGSLYRIEVLVDGKIKKTVNKQAPASDDLVIPVTDWFPVSIDEVLNRDCR